MRIAATSSRMSRAAGTTITTIRTPLERAEVEEEVGVVTAAETVGGGPVGLQFWAALN